MAEEEDTFVCAVDRGDYGLSDIRMLACHHCICLTCLEQQITAALDAPDTSEQLKCPLDFCPGKIDKFIIMKNFPKLFDRYSVKMSGKALIDGKNEDEKIL